MLNYIDLFDDYSIVELLVIYKFDLKLIIDLNVRVKYGCIILVIKYYGDICFFFVFEDVIYE